MKPPKISLCGAVILLFCFWNCAERSPVSPLPFEENLEKVNGETTRTSERALVIRNPLGGLIVTGSNARDVLRWSLTKIVSSRGGFAGGNEFAQIALQAATRNDTLFFEIIAPGNSDALKYLCGLALVMPANMACHVVSVGGLVNISNLDTTLSIAGAKYEINIAQHSGSLEVAAMQGSIAVENVLPDSGFCLVNTGQGNIAIKLPGNTSAQLHAYTSNGRVNSSGLVFTHILELSPKTLRATLGEGRGQINLSTAHGDISMQGF